MITHLSTLYENFILQQIIKSRIINLLMSLYVNTLRQLFPLKYRNFSVMRITLLFKEKIQIKKKKN